MSYEAPRLPGFAPMRIIQGPMRLVAFLILLLSVPPSVGQTNDPIIAKVNGTEIHESELREAAQELGDNVPEGSDPEARRQMLIGYLTDRILIGQAADKKGVQETEEFKRQLDVAKNKIKMQIFLLSAAQDAADDAAVRKAYDEAVRKMADVREVRLREMRLKNEERAKLVIADLRAGRDFVELAKQESLDAAASTGGDLGYLTQEQLPPELSKAAFALEKGQFSDPVKIDADWYIVKIEDKRQKPIPPFDDIKGELKAYLIQKSQVDLITKLRASAKVELPTKSLPSK